MSRDIPGCTCGLLKGFCPVHPPAPDFAAAIKRIEGSRYSHQQWADFLEAYPDHLETTARVAETIQTREEHEAIVADYDNVLRCLSVNRSTNIPENGRNTPNLTPTAGALESRAILHMRRIVAYWDSLDAIGEDDGETSEYVARMQALVDEARLILESGKVA